MDLDTYIWHTWPQYIDSQSNPCFSHFSTLTGEYPKNLGQLTTNPVHLSSLRKIPNIWDFPTYQPFYFTETEAKPEYLGLGTSITANFSNNTGYTLQYRHVLN